MCGRCAVTATWLVAVLVGVSQAIDQETADHAPDTELSPKCAAVLLTSGTALGAGITYAVTPALLVGYGFGAAGVTKGSFAAAWQSTMSVVGKGSLFALLQSTAASGVGFKATVTGAAVGSVAAAQFLHSFCRFVDETADDSLRGVLLERNLELVQTVHALENYASDACSSSYTCNTAAEMSSSALQSVWEGTTEASSSAWKYIQTAVGSAASVASSFTFTPAEHAQSPPSEAERESGAVVKNLEMWSSGEVSEVLRCCVVRGVAAARVVEDYGVSGEDIQEFLESQAPHAKNPLSIPTEQGGLGLGAIQVAQLRKELRKRGAIVD